MEDGTGPQTAGIHHVGLVVADAPRALRFYRDVLGLDLAWRSVRPDDAMAHQLYLSGCAGAPGGLLGLEERGSGEPGGWGLGGIHHVALGVEDEAALLRWKRWLARHGVAASGPYDRVWFHSLYFRDPDGHILELATRGPGYGLDEPMHALGAREVVPAAAHLAGRRDEAAIRARTHPEPVERIGPEMRIAGIHHVSGLTDDVARAHGFLQHALGLRLVKRSVNQDSPGVPHWFWAHYDGREVAPASSYTLFGFARGMRPVRQGVGQPTALAFRARDDEQLEAWRERLREQGVEVSGVEDRGAFRSVRFHAPDGQPLELATELPVPGAAAGPGPELRLPEWLEPHRAEIERGLAPLS